ncbi:hypothetical protein SDC9_174112 [bioreactor metagenome]|uniref:Uncharacterized protein n=1 Tax=bioreactor metagenome TaxID=1076179 RepID=A0A645GIC0_9ZZZZ
MRFFRPNTVSRLVITSRKWAAFSKRSPAAASAICARRMSVTSRMLPSSTETARSTRSRYFSGVTAPTQGAEQSLTMRLRQRLRVSASGSESRQARSPKWASRNSSVMRSAPPFGKGPKYCAPSFLRNRASFSVGNRSARSSLSRR